MTPPPSVAQIRTQVERMRALARTPAQLAVRNERASAWSPAEHLDHIAKVALWALRILGKEELRAAPKGRNVLGRLVLLLGWIPRGWGRSPERVRGTPATAAEIDAALTQVEQLLDALPYDSLRTSRMPAVGHPLFGALTPIQALRFVAVHTSHHLRIVDDILAR